NAVEMSKTDYDFIIWFIMDQLVKNLGKAKFEDKHLLEQKVFDIIQGAKIPKDAEMVMCNVFAQQSAKIYDKYIPTKQILKSMKRRHIAVYDVYANHIIFEFKKLFGLITITETQAFTKIKLFGIPEIYKKYKGHKPIQVKNYPVNLVDGMPKVSIIVPFYNVEKYVGECMESLINQTMKDIEIICIDDCGTDNSRQIVEKFAQNDKRIKIVTNDKNRGLSYSRNVGIKHATAPYITFCDSDDLLTHDACEKLFNAVHNKSDIAVCSMDILYEADKEKQKQDEYLKLQNDGVFDMNKSVQVSCNVCTPAKLYKRQIIVENKIEFPVGLRHEDEFFYPAYCIWAKKITWLSDALYIYRRRQESIMNSVHKATELNLDPVKVTIKYLEYCKKLGVWQREKHWFWDVMFPGMFNASLRHSGPIHTKTCFAYAKKCIEKHFSAKDLHPMIVQKINSIRKRKF
ncbi:MAG: glycosyltransferase family 2 protein, partial [Alphaproteobacteria bacterium]|nr:glycosyltransferase family 2 protein [Alphaproteobacteria bacterium]